MQHETLVRNPFMLMTNPEAVIAAVERSERLKQLNRHLCRPLDRIGPPGTGAAGGDESDAATADDVALDPDERGTTVPQ